MDYYEKSFRFLQCIGQNLPSLFKLEISYSQSFKSRGLLWLFVQDPKASFPSLFEDLVLECYDNDISHLYDLLDDETPLNPICKT